MIWNIDWKKDLFRNSWHRNPLKFHTPKTSVFPLKEYRGNFWPESPFVPFEPPPEQHYVDNVADAELAYKKWQIHEGREVFKNGVEPQDASELQNLMAYMEHNGIYENPGSSEGIDLGSQEFY